MKKTVIHLVVSNLTAISMTLKMFDEKFNNNIFEKYTLIFLVFAIFLNAFYTGYIFILLTWYRTKKFLKLSKDLKDNLKIKEQMKEWDVFHIKKQLNIWYHQG